jgi:hypothetical protein
VRHFGGKKKFRISGLPAGNYNRIQFLLGVDSLRNVSGAQTGDLDPVNDMFWDWNTGYIYFKMEGEFKTVQQPAGDAYAIHIGGFKQPYPCLQSVELIMDTVLNISAGGMPVVTVKADAAQVFTSPHDMGFDFYYNNISDRTFQKISENYRDMFTIMKVQN